MMTRSLHLLAALAVSFAVLTPLAHAQDRPLLKEMPPDRELRQGRSVYVDDGTCPAGEIKQVTGGNRDKGIARRVQCVKRPDTAATP
ncbi:MAG: hypothetical protein EOO54_14445 [Haliea sp.]|nr:MAG: hypothetical protein EOO54_14445 [Haliea sp.]